MVGVFTGFFAKQPITAALNCWHSSLVYAKIAVRPNIIGELCSKQCGLRCDAGPGTAAQPAAAWCQVWMVLARRPETQGEAAGLEGGMREDAGRGTANHGWLAREILVKNITGKIAGW